MDINHLISCLNYTDSPYYLSGERLYEYPAYSHIFRLASEKCNLHGVYTLKIPEKNHPSHGVLIPVVYVCEANTDQQAREIHRLVWNQNIVPFLIILSPKTIRLYPGFNFDPRLSETKPQSIIAVANTISEVLEKLSDFTSDSIDRGDLWTNRDKEIPQNKRVDRRLLRSLKSLSTWLRDNGVPRQTAHALIGKFVYLYYLRDRKILSDRKLGQWSIDKESVFGRNATLAGFYAVTGRLEDWLNGVVFPVPKKGQLAPKVEHIQKVSSAFLGDDPESGQMHMDFKAYNFEYIPIETLSIVYQQFLHAEGKGRGRGAYYTPIHLVNFVLDELDLKRPFQRGMKVLDPACGSGAFLVQCYRRLIEREQAKNPAKRLQPSELRYLMTNHIYGMDVDKDACGVTELSLILTLLDYVDPPDLEKLPALRNRNIFCCKDGFFKPNAEWEENKPGNGFDWIVG
ncbi:MAG: N-6 DNA methylase, partial [Patescibacteria group bacterium]|nr:N-6 DNA methylase [Patescibacteria group bacterium]